MCSSDLVPTLKFALKGNVDDPIASPKQAANLGTQTTRVAPSVLASTIKTAQLVEISASDTFRMKSKYQPPKPWRHLDQYLSR